MPTHRPLSSRPRPLLSLALLVALASALVGAGTAAAAPSKTGASAVSQSRKLVWRHGGHGGRHGGRPVKGTGTKAPVPVSTTPSPTPAPTPAPAEGSTPKKPTTPSAPTPPAAPTVPTTPPPPAETAPVPPVQIPPVAPEPPVEPLPTPELPTPGTLLFNGVKASDYGIEAAPRAVTEVPDPAGSGATVFSLTVNNQDVAPITPTNNPRAQMLSPAIIKPGDEFWLETKFYIPAGMPYVSEWMSLVSIYGPPFAGSSPWQISINGNELQWMRNGAHGYDIPWKAPLASAQGKWTTVLLHEKFATAGFVEMWINGQQLNFFAPGSSRNSSHEAETNHLSMSTMDSSNGGGPNSAKIMQYRAVNMFQTASLYFQPLRVGTSRAAVEY